MRQLLYIVGIALLAGAIFASCKNAEDTTKTATLLLKVFGTTNW